MLLYYRFTNLCQRSAVAERANRVADQIACKRVYAHMSIVACGKQIVIGRCDDAIRRVFHAQLLDSIKRESAVIVFENCANQHRSIGRVCDEIHEASSLKIADLRAKKFNYRKKFYFYKNNLLLTGTKLTP